MFLGFANFYQKFISNFSKQTKSLSNLLPKNSQSHWSPKALHTFQQLKFSFTTAPVLAHPDMIQVFIVEANSFSTAIRAVLYQRHRCKQVLHPTTYYLRKFIPVDQNYEILDKEVLAIKTTKLVTCLGRDLSSSPRMYSSRESGVPV
ncbi:unnamed protein product [Eretmochelys imbricata]